VDVPADFKQETFSGSGGDAAPFVFCYVAWIPLPLIRPSNPLGTRGVGRM